MGYTYYRSGKIPDLDALGNRNSKWFDALTKIPEDCSPRSTSVFASLTLKEAEGWVDWRLDAGLDADIWTITIPTPALVHPVELYENSRYIHSLLYDENVKVNATPEKCATNYWKAGTAAPPVDREGFWEVLIPHSIAVGALWTLVKPVNPVQEQPVENSYF